MTAPKTAKLTRKLKALPLALTSDGPGTVRIALVKGATVVAKGAKTIGAAGTYGYKLKIAKASKLKAGTYRLKVAFTPKGATKSSTKKTLRIKLVKPKAGKASVAMVVTVATTKRR